MLKKIEKDELFEKMVTGVRDEFKASPQSVKRRPALGKGLSSLMGLSEVPVEETEKQPKVEKIAETTSHVVQPAIQEPEIVEEPLEVIKGERFEYLPIRKVVANPSQPRRRFAEDDLNSLAASIKESGVIQPIIVRSVAENVFEIVAGERRFRAAKIAGLDKVPAVVKELDEQATLELSIIENVQRADLNPVEEAIAYKRLADEFGLNQEGIAKTVGKDRASIANSMRLLGLEPEIQELLAEGKLSAGHGRALLMKEPGKERLVFALRVVKDGLSVRATEALAKRVESKSIASKPSPYAKDVEASLRRSLGTKVKVKISPSGTGEIRLSFFSPEELDGLLEKLSV